jgi:hypothetical protein
MASTSNEPEYIATRPAVTFDPAIALPLESFQGLVLRPLFKQWNNDLIEAFVRALGKSKSQYLTMNEKDRVALIHSLVATKQSFRNSVFRMLRNECTKTELEFIQLHRREFGKRITALLTERFRTQHEFILKKLNALQ